MNSNQNVSTAIQKNLLSLNLIIHIMSKIFPLPDGVLHKSGYFHPWNLIDCIIWLLSLKEPTWCVVYLSVTSINRSQICSSTHLPRSGISSTYFVFKIIYCYFRSDHCECCFAFAEQTCYPCNISRICSIFIR